MNKALGPMMGVIMLAGCAQFTTSEQELVTLQQTADSAAEAYISCIKTEATNYSASDTELSYVVDAAGRKCKAELEKYEAAQAEFLSSQYMMIDKKMQESTAELNQRAADEVTEVMLIRQPQTASSQPATSVNSGAAATAGITAAAPAAGWTAEQRVYLDCMEDQGRKFARLDESSTSIAQVAQSRCSNYLSSPNAALEQEGRNRVMGIVFDTKLKSDKFKQQTEF
jgi:hypothetical protein